MPKPTFNIHNPLGLKLLACLRLGLIYLNEHRFDHNFYGLPKSFVFM